MTRIFPIMGGESHWPSCPWPCGADVNPSLRGYVRGCRWLKGLFIVLSPFASAKAALPFGICNAWERRQGFRQEHKGLWEGAELSSLRQPPFPPGDLERGQPSARQAWGVGVLSWHDFANLSATILPEAGAAPQPKRLGRDWVFWEHRGRACARRGERGILGPPAGSGA